MQNSNNININHELKTSYFKIFLGLVLVLWFIFKLYSFPEFLSYVRLDSEVEWRLIANSDLTKITTSILSESWQESILDTNKWNIFNPRSNPNWSDNNVPLSMYYVENIQNGDITRLRDIWPVANKHLENMGLPSLPIKSECLSGLDILHEKFLKFNDPYTQGLLKILREPQVSFNERIIKWLADQQK